MNPLAFIFFPILMLAFAILFFFLRAEPASRSARQRLVSIQESVGLHRSAAYADDLGADGQQSFSSRLGSLLERYGFSKRIRTLLIHSGSRMDLGGAVLASVCAGLGLGLLSYLVLRSFLLSSAMVAAGSTTPWAMLRFQRARRLKAFNDALPDAIDLMARSLLAGHSMGSSIELVAEQSPEPLAFEFVQVFQQQRLGLHFRDALLQMGARVPSRDLQFLITAILVQKETGGDLTEILARASHVIRERVRIEGEVLTRTAQGRLTGWILALLPVVMLAFISFCTPGYSGILFHDPVGQKLLYAGGSLIILGGLVIRKIVDVKV